MKISKNKQFPTKIFAALLVTALLGAGFAYAYFIADVFPGNSSGSTAASDNSENTATGLEQPTVDEVEENQSAKERLLEESDQTGNETDRPDTKSPEQVNKKPVTVGITYAGIAGDNLEVRAFSPTIISGAGTCTATASKSGSQTITESTPAFIDASSTICQPIYIPKSELSVGSWNVEVTFSSPTHKGSSGPTKVEVQ